MTRSLTKELFTPFKDQEREFRSSRKHFKTLSLDELRSPDFDLLSDQEEYSEEEVAETMAETMEQYMSKTRADYGSGVARPKIEDRDHFELKGQFLKELRTNTFSGSDHEDANEHIEKVLEIVGAIPSKTAADAKVAIQEMAEYSQKWHNGTSRTRSNETSDGLAAIQAQLNNLGREIKKVNEKVYVAQVGYEQWEYRAAALGFYQRNNANPSYQERRQSMEETLSKFIGESKKRHEENSNLIKEIRASTGAAIRNQRASIKTLEIQIGQMSKVLQERGFRSLPSSTETNLRAHVKSILTTVEANASSIRRIGSHQYTEKDQGSFTLPFYINNVCFDNALADLGASVSVMPLSTYLNLGLGELAHTKLIVELADRTVKYPKGIAENVLVGIGKFVFLVDFIILDMPEDIKVPLILGRLFLSAAHAKIDVFKRKITLRVEEEKIVFKSVKPASSLIKRVYMLSLRERMELDLEARLMGETLVLNRSLDPFFGDYIKLNDLNVALELRRDQVNDLMPTIEEGEVVEEFRARNDARMVSEIFGYPSDCNHDKKIHIDCAHNLKFSCMIVIMKYLVKISKKARILELKRRYLKITVLTPNTPYPSRKIQRICACTSLKTTKETRSIRDPWDQRVRSRLIGKDLVSGLLVYALSLSSLRKKYRLNLKNDMPPRDKSTNRTTGKSPFFIVYGPHPITPLDLAPIPITEPVSVEGDDRSKQIKELHQKVHGQITKHNQQYEDRANKHRNDGEMDSWASAFQGGKDDTGALDHNVNMAAYLTF
ncbi:DNA-directed DNA polymerase [Tanacetum coccineum]